MSAVPSLLETVTFINEPIEDNLLEVYDRFEHVLETLDCPNPNDVASATVRTAIFKARERIEILLHRHHEFKFNNVSEPSTNPRQRRLFRCNNVIDCNFNTLKVSELKEHCCIDHNISVSEADTVLSCLFCDEYYFAYDLDSMVSHLQEDHKFIGDEFIMTRPLNAFFLSSKMSDITKIFQLDKDQGIEKADNSIDCSEYEDLSPRDAIFKCRKCLWRAPNELALKGHTRNFLGKCATIRGRNFNWNVKKISTSVIKQKTTSPFNSNESQIQEITVDNDLNNQIQDVKNEEEANPPSCSIDPTEFSIPEILDRIKGKKCIGFGCKQILNMTNGKLLRHLTNHFRYAIHSGSESLKVQAKKLVKSN